MTPSHAPQHLDGRPGTAPSGPAGRRPPGRPSGRRGDGRRPRDRLLRHVWSLSRLLLDIEVGLRPQRQLEPFATDELRARLADFRGRPCRGGAPPPVVRAVRGVHTTAHRFDAVVLIQRGQRLTSIGLGLVRLEDRWLLDELALPGGPPIPPPAYPLPCDPLDHFELTASDP